MPYIDSKITVPMDDSKKEKIKAELGRMLATLGKPESYLMVGIADNYDLWFAGKKLDKGAYVEVSVLGGIDPYQSNQFSAQVCDLFEKELGIPQNAVYITYHGIENWGWNGGNF